MKLGLKNYLFVQSVLGSEALAGFYSLIVTCNHYNLNLYEYFSDVLYRIADGHPQAKIDDLLPGTGSPIKLNHYGLEVHRFAGRSGRPTESPVNLTDDLQIHQNSDLLHHDALNTL